MKLDFIGSTDKGLVRSGNQDNHYVDPKGRFFILADGMGGHAGGETASLIAVQTIKEILDKNWDAPDLSRDLLEKAILQANDNILEDQNIHSERSEMGTTIVVVLFRNAEVWRAHVGDSRLYRLRNSQLEQISEDHTWIAQAISSEQITLEEAKTHPWRHVLSQCVGRQDLIGGRIDIETMDIQYGDRFLLCSDGLTEEVEDPLIAKTLGEPLDLETVAKNLIQEAKNGGGSDNITIVLIGIPTLKSKEQNKKKNILPLPEIPALHGKDK